MTTETKKKIRQRMFGDYQGGNCLPFKIIASPCRKTEKYEKRGHWNEKQKLRYTIFITFFRRLVQDKQKQKFARIYEMMSDVVITRNACQCRSHHQKMMNQNKSSIDLIVEAVSQKYEPRVYKELTTKYETYIEILWQNYDKYIRAPSKFEEVRQQHPTVLTESFPVTEKKPTEDKRRTREDDIDKEQDPVKQQERQVSNYQAGCNQPTLSYPPPYQYPEASYQQLRLMQQTHSMFPPFPIFQAMNFSSPPTFFGNQINPTGNMTSGFDIGKNAGQAQDQVGKVKCPSSYGFYELQKGLSVSQCKMGVNHRQSTGDELNQLQFQMDQWSRHLKWLDIQRDEAQNTMKYIQSQMNSIRTARDQPSGRHAQK